MNDVDYVLYDLLKNDAVLDAFIVDNFGKSATFFHGLPYIENQDLFPVFCVSKDVGDITIKSVEKTETEVLLSFTFIAETTDDKNNAYAGFTESEALLNSVENQIINRFREYDYNGIVFSQNTIRFISDNIQYFPNRSRLWRIKVLSKNIK